VAAARAEKWISIIIGEETFPAKSKWRSGNSDLLRVKGKDLPVRIFELLGRKGELTETEEQKRELFSHGLALYRNCKWSEAVSFFRRSSTSPMMARNDL
jgi:adenylate cyclase